MPTKPKTKFKIGDRVAERPKMHGIFAVRKEVEERIAQYRSQRYGVVVGIKEKPTATKQMQKVLVIQWDHLKSPTEHAQMRICLIHELDKLTKEVIVPGE